jgi:RNA polymerase sigma-70 factor (ECF subfamily)
MPLADRDEIERAFQRLTQDQRTVLTLVYFADLSLADAAVALGIPIGTTKSRLHHALIALRAALAAAERVPELKGGVA